jgi:hypothetical protein
MGFVPRPIVLFLFFFYLEQALEQAFSFLGSRAGGPAFFSSLGSFNVLVRCIGPSGYINWSNFS